MLEVLPKDERAMPAGEFLRSAHRRARELRNKLGQQQSRPADADKPRC